MRAENAVVAAISLPYTNLHYTAVQGSGAYVNGRRIQISATTNLSTALIAIGDYALGERAIEKNRQRNALNAALAAKVERIRMFGSAAHDLAWLAEGRIDGVVVMSNKVHDIAAGVLIAREAGARVVDSSGFEHTISAKDTIACTPAIADDLIHLVQASIRMSPPEVSGPSCL